MYQSFAVLISHLYKCIHEHMVFTTNVSRLCFLLKVLSFSPSWKSSEESEIQTIRFQFWFSVRSHHYQINQGITEFGHDLYLCYFTYDRKCGFAFLLLIATILLLWEKVRFCISFAYKRNIPIQCLKVLRINCQIVALKRIVKVLQCPIVSARKRKEARWNQNLE